MVYEIRFYVSAPVITTTQIHLDGILSAVHPAMHNLSWITRQSARSEVKTAPLPIDSAKIGSKWVFCCTASDFDDSAKVFTDKFNKRKDAIDYHYITRRLTPRSGPGRDRLETCYGVLCEYVRFYASTTDLREMERICKRVRSIGNLRKMGYGSVSCIEINKTELSWKECLVLNGIAMRNMPACMVDEGFISRIPVQSPYWLSDNIEHGVMAGEKCFLADGVWLNEYK